MIISRIEAYNKLRTIFGIRVNPITLDFPVTVNWTEAGTIEFVDAFGNFCTYYPLDKVIRVKRKESD